MHHIEQGILNYEVTTPKRGWGAKLEKQPLAVQGANK